MLRTELVSTNVLFRYAVFNNFAENSLFLELELLFDYELL